MANRTLKDAPTIKGTNPQYLIEKIIRSRIYDCRYWKEDCFALTAELLVDKAAELKYIGGVCGGNIRPTPFLCLILKMLQICPEKDIVVEFIKNEDFKYVRALGAFYMRLAGTSVEIYKYLEPLYNDSRKMKYLTRDEKYQLIHMDEFIDQLLREERVLDIQLPRLQKRNVLEENNELEARQSILDEDIENESSDESDEEEEKEERQRVKEKEREKDKDKDKEKKKKKKSKKNDDEKPKKKWQDLDKPERSPSPRYGRSPSPRDRSSRKRRRSRSRSRSKSRSPRDSRKKHSSRHDRRRRD